MRWSILFLCTCGLLNQTAIFAQEKLGTPQKSLETIKKLGGTVSSPNPISSKALTITLTACRDPGACLPYLKDVQNLQILDL